MGAPARGARFSLSTLHCARSRYQVDEEVKERFCDEGINHNVAAEFAYFVTASRSRAHHLLPSVHSFWFFQRLQAGFPCAPGCAQVLQTPRPPRPPQPPVPVCSLPPVNVGARIARESSNGLAAGHRTRSRHCDKARGLRLWLRLPARSASATRRARR